MSSISENRVKGGRSFPAQAKGFVPVPDLLIAHYANVPGCGFITAMVWGKVWRYCHMRDGVCRATLERLGTELGMSEKTVQRHIHQLVKDGFLEDMTPSQRNRPHIYRDSGKVTIRVSISAEAGQPTFGEKSSRHSGSDHYEPSDEFFAGLLDA